jgi:hypothetical protein
MKRRYSLEFAIKEARKVRRNLLRNSKWRYMDLGGACGLASILLSIAVNDVSILRYADLPSGGGHVWTVVKDTIVDVTASQFNQEDDFVRGVLVTDIPKSYHPLPSKTGVSVHRLVVNKKWYREKDHHNWEKISEHWL